MKHLVTNSRRSRSRGERGYVIVFFAIILAFVGVIASMQVLILTSVATTSRAFDRYRQGATEASRLEQAVTEALLEQRQIAIGGPGRTLSDSLTARLADVAAADAEVVSTPDTLPAIGVFPDAVSASDALGGIPADLLPLLSPELLALTGARVAGYPELRFEFATAREALDQRRVYRTEVRARLIAVPLTRFPLAAYDLPGEIGAAVTSAAADSMLPAGLVPGRDPAFVADLQTQSGVLPYHYRRRAVLAAAYQYLFSASYLDRVAEYAGITHFRDLDGGAGTATLTGLSQVGLVATWDLGTAGTGTYNTITASRDAAVVFTEQGGHTLRLLDSVGSDAASPLLLVIAGPSTSACGPLRVELSSVLRPVVIVGYHVQVAAAPNSVINGALFLDPASSLALNGPFSVGHLSIAAAGGGADTQAIAIRPMPAAAEALAPRVVYVAAAAHRL